MNHTILALSLGVALLLTACGGGTSAKNLSVSAATADRISYGQLSTFTITGTDLSDTQWSAAGCSNLVTINNTPEIQVLTCTPSAASVVLSSQSGGNFTKSWLVPKPQVTLNIKDYGDVVIELEPSVVQITVDNFLGYVRSGFYDGTIFHRVMPDFVVQGGGFIGQTSSTLTPQTGLQSPIPLETNKGLSNQRGTVAMARTQAANSATSQYFINLVNNTALDYQNASNPGYAVFGTVIEGMSFFDTMATQSTGTVGLYSNVPTTDIVVTAATQTQ